MLNSLKDKEPVMSAILLTACFALTALGCCVSSRETDSPSSQLTEGHAHALDIFKKRMGLFIHWPGGRFLSDGRRVRNVNEFADAEQMLEGRWPGFTSSGK